MQDRVITQALFPELERFILAREAEDELITAERKAVLETIAEGLSEMVSGSETGVPQGTVVFVCTHNSRRSHISHLLFAANVARRGHVIPSGSAGTEATAFHPNAVAALQRIGFRVGADGARSNASEHGDFRLSGAENPRYEMMFSEVGDPAIAFSKTLAHEEFARSPLFAVMVCNHADQACPSVPGALARHSLPFVDPKAGDGTAHEARGYDECVETVGREMAFLARSI